MNKQLSLALLLSSLLVLPGCWKKKNNKEKEVILQNESSSWQYKPDETEKCDSEENETSPNFYDEEITRKSIFDDGEQIVYVETTQIKKTFETENENRSSMQEESEVTSRQSIGTVLFDFDSSVIRNDQKKNLLALTSFIKKELSHNPELIVILEGHACASAGSQSYNLFISDCRAHALYDYLAKQGISKNRMRFLGFGTAHLIVPAGDSTLQAPNRRVEIYLGTQEPVVAIQEAA